MHSQSGDVSQLEEALGHRFLRPELLQQALTHSSFARELESQSPADPNRRNPTTSGDNEQLEFLGDAVLSFVISQELFRRFPEYGEGELSKLRAHIVSERGLIRAAEHLNMGKYLRFGRGEEKSGGRGKITLLVDALEAVIAALYLDAGIEPAHSFVVNSILEPELRHLEEIGGGRMPIMDYKSALQESTHAEGRPQPRYVVVREQGPEHRKLFTVEVYIGSGNGDPGLVCRAEGSSKKSAEQKAAQQAFERLKSVERGSAADDRSPSAESSSEA